MYSVVGCSSCQALWVVEDRPDTTQCPRCRTRHDFDALKAFAEAETSDEAARARSAMLAERADEGEFVDPAAVDPDEVGMTDEGYLTASGLEADAVAAAGEHAGSKDRSRSRKAVVLDALATLEEPTAPAIREYAAEHGVGSGDVDRALSKLQRAGEVTEANGVYRQL